VVAPVDGDSDPWGKKVVAPADGDSDPWGKKVILNTGATQKESSSDKVWDKQAGVGGSDAGGSSWDRTSVSQECKKSDNWGQACRVADMGAGGDADPWGNKVKAADMEGTDSWDKATMPPDNKLEGVSRGWEKPLGKSNEDQVKDNISKAEGNNGAWDTALPATEDGTWGKSKDSNDGAGGWNDARSSDKIGGAGGWDTSAANWNKSSVVAEPQEEGWGKGKGALDQAGLGDWGKPKSFDGDGSSSWNKGEGTRADDQNNSWSRRGSFGGGRGFVRGRGRGRGRGESGDSNGTNDHGSWKSSWGGDNAARPSWGCDSNVDNAFGDSGGYRGRGRGGRGQYGGRGRDNGWRNGDRSNSGFGRENDSADGQKWGNRGASDWNKDASNKGSWGGGDNWNATNPPNNQPWSSSGGTKSYGENKPSTWNSSEDNKTSVGQ
jgi:transcription elongation factor SPT5